MKNLFLKGTKDTPTIDFDKDKNVLEISGSSYPEDTFKFYAPINDWMEEFLKITGRQIQVNFKMLHFNSSSALFYLEFLKLLESYQLQTAKQNLFGFSLQISKGVLQKKADTKSSICLFL